MPGGGTASQVVGTVVLASILVICVWDSVDSLRKHLQLRQERVEGDLAPAQ